MEGAIAPPGWPADLAPPTTEEFAARVSGWLLDRCPPQFRSTFTVRRHPIVLAHVALHHSDAVVAAQRETYRSARRELSDHLPADVLAGVLTDFEAVGHQVVGSAREVRLVWEALQGAVWRPKL